MPADPQDRADALAVLLAAVVLLAFLWATAASEIPETQRGVAVQLTGRLP